MCRLYCYQLHRKYAITCISVSKETNDVPDCAQGARQHIANCNVFLGNRAIDDISIIKDVYRWVFKSHHPT